MEWIETIAMWAGWIAAIGSALMYIIKFKGKNDKKVLEKDAAARRLKELEDSVQDLAKQINFTSAQLNKISEDLDGNREVLKQQCRNTIKNIYRMYANKQEMPKYEWDTINATYEIYINKLQGNSYIHDLYEQMSEWDKI